MSTYAKIPIRVTIPSGFITYDLFSCMSSLIPVPHFDMETNMRELLWKIGSLYSVIQKLTS